MSDDNGIANRVLEFLVRDKLRLHPLPWKVEQDWTWEVHSEGGLVMKFPEIALAAAFIDMAMEIEATDAGTVRELEEKHGVKL